MSTIISKLTIIYDKPFYKAIFERNVTSSYEICSVVLGTSEPKTTYIYKLINKHWDSLNFSKQTNVQTIIPKKINPKRMQRIVNKQINSNISTKAQLAIKKSIETSKKSKKTRHKLAKELENNKKFEIKQRKRKAKHRGH